MRESKIVAVDHVHLEAPIGVEDSLQWFYIDLCGLDPVDQIAVDQSDAAGEDGHRLRFRSEHLEVRIGIRHEPRVETVACRVTIRVEDLQATREHLEERQIAYQPLTGVTFSDRRIAVCDPAGNRVELKHGWPSVTL